MSSHGMNGLVPQHEQREAGQRGEEEQREERFVQSVLRFVADRRVATATQNPEPERSDEQTHAADCAENDRQARVGIRRAPAEHVVVECRDRRRGEAEKEAVEGAVVQPASPR